MLRYILSYFLIYFFAHVILLKLFFFAFFSDDGRTLVGRDHFSVHFCINSSTTKNVS